MDRADSTVAFEVRHLKVARVRGRFGAFEGHVDIASQVGIAGSVEVASVDTGDPVRDQRLCAEDFFDAAAHPRMEFEPTTRSPTGTAGASRDG